MIFLLTKTRSIWLTATLLCVGSFVLADVFTESTAAKEGSARRGASSNLGRSRQGINQDKNAPGQQRLREGTLISDQEGYFREDGDGATFVADTGLEFGALPNLNLERVARLLKSAEQPSSIRWSVSGKVTEFTGKNFLLISRAVYKSVTPPPMPEQVVQTK